MKLVISENIWIEQKYNMFEFDFRKNFNIANDAEWFEAQMFGYNPTKIYIKGKAYNVIPLHIVARTKSTDDYYRFIYIQINMVTNEYYIGKVNRKRWKEIIKYQGSGLLFKSKYSKHKEEFVRYYIAACNSQEETEIIEATIVDDVLLKDEKCLNLVKGGGGTNNRTTTKDRREKQSEYMKNHPERYQAMVKAAKELYCSGSSIQLEQRGKRIKATMNSDKYREMSRKRILKWKEENPNEYAKARENNKLAQQSEQTRKKRSDSFNKWREENPEAYIEQQKILKAARSTEQAKKKRSESLKKYYNNNPEAKERLKKEAEAAREKQKKSVNMIDLETGKILRIFNSQHDAVRWLVENRIAKNLNCVSSINAVCLKRPCSTGYGYRKKAYGFGWEFSNNLNEEAKSSK